jgi:hypothetical protein
VVASRSACWEAARTLPDRMVRLMANEDYDVVNRGIGHGKKGGFPKGVCPSPGLGQYMRCSGPRLSYSPVSRQGRLSFSRAQSLYHLGMV